MDLTLFLVITLLIVIILLSILFFKHNKLKKDFMNYDPNPVFGPGRYNYGRDDPKRILKEMRLESIRRFLTFKWTWYWTTKEYKKRKKIQKNFTKKFEESVKRKNMRKKSHNIDDISDLAKHPKIKK